MISTETIATRSTGITAPHKRKRKSGSEESWTTALDRIDEALSRPVFRLSLPKWFELVFSIPANFFGTTATLMIGPLWVTLLTLSVQETPSYDSNVIPRTRMLHLGAITLSLTAVYVVSWLRIQICQQRSKLFEKLFFNKKLYALAIPWDVGILEYALPGSWNDLNHSDYSSTNMPPRAIFSMAIYPLFLFPFMILVISYLKSISRRTRPAKKDIERGTRGENWTSRKQFPVMTNFLARHNGNASFPSADVAMATLLAIPLWNLNKRLAISIVFMSALGRMYVLAHHLLDVLSGALITLGVHATATAFLGTNIMYQIEWWHPLLATVGFIAFEIISKKNQVVFSKQVGK